jgi:cysteinyl-tRNA synthetase
MKKSFVIIMVIAAAVVSGCSDDSTNHGSPTSRDYRQDMRDFVTGISVYAKGINPDLISVRAQRRFAVLQSELLGNPSS